MADKTLTIRELLETVLRIPPPIRIERDIEFNGRVYHAVVYRQTQMSRDVIGADIRSIEKTPAKPKTRKEKSDHGKAHTE